MTDILETLENAEYNLAHPIGPSLVIARNQLHNALTLLEKGFKLETDVDKILAEYGNVENVPGAETLDREAGL